MSNHWKKLEALSERNNNMKKWHQSKTLWANIIAIIALIAAYLTGDADLQTTVQEVVAPVLALLNIVLRLITNQPVAGFGKRA